MDSLIKSFSKLSTVDFSIFSDLFEKCVNGYHLVNDDPIKESPWEDINALIFKKAGCNIDLLSNGSHKSGSDLTCTINNSKLSFSNKSSRKYKKNFKISSYRLTCVCSNKDHGDIDKILNEIDKRKDYDYYSIIVREETENNINYMWYVIPSDYHELNPRSYKWNKKINKDGVVTGWETDTINGSSMSISFSMSSQLWIDLMITNDLDKFKVSTCNVLKGRKYDYIDLYDNNINNNNNWNIKLIININNN